MIKYLAFVIALCVGNWSYGHEGGNETDPDVDYRKNMVRCIGYIYASFESVMERITHDISPHYNPRTFRQDIIETLQADLGDLKMPKRLETEIQMGGYDHCYSVFGNEYLKGLRKVRNYLSDYLKMFSIVEAMNITSSAKTLLFYKNLTHCYDNLRYFHAQYQQIVFWKSLSADLLYLFIKSSEKAKPARVKKISRKKSFHKILGTYAVVSQVETILDGIIEDYLDQFNPLMITHDYYFFHIRRWWHESELTSNAMEAESIRAQEIEELDDAQDYNIEEHQNGRNCKKRKDKRLKEREDYNDNHHEKNTSVEGPSTDFTQSHVDPIGNVFHTLQELKVSNAEHKVKVAKEKTRGRMTDGKNIKAQRDQERLAREKNNSDSLPEELPPLQIGDRARTAIEFITGQTRESDYDLNTFCNGFTDLVDDNPKHFLKCRILGDSGGSGLVFSVCLTNGEWRSVYPHRAHKYKGSMGKIPKEFAKDYAPIFEKMGVLKSNKGR